VRVLLVGLGRWGEKHLRVLGELGAEVWVAEVAADRRRLAERAGVPAERAVADLEAALPHVEAVDLVTPADSHLALAEASLAAGRDCFVEKPLTLTSAEALALRARVRASGRLLQVGHIFRFHPVTEVLRARLADGTTGPLRYCAARFAGFKRPRTDVGVTQTDAIHFFDLFADLLGRAPTAVTATLRDHLGRGLDDFALATVDYDGIPAHVEAGYFVPGTVRECLLVGERATLLADFGTSEVRVHENRHGPAAGGWQAVQGPVEVIQAVGPEPLRRELELFLEAARRGPSPVDVEAGLLALRTVEAAQRSSRLGRRVALDEVP
jgi:UDP-2-acetamido-3-amino-2,3-dideoxy-glucuronate N-acetyltransferase